MKTVKLPSVAYYPDFCGYDIISYLPRERAGEDNLKNIKLPKWLSELIECEVKHSFEKGKEAKTEEIKSVLGLK